MTFVDPDLEALLHRAMDAAREVLAERALIVQRGCFFAEVNGPGVAEAVRIGASFPPGDSLASSELAMEAAQAYSVKAALESLREVPDE